MTILLVAAEPGGSLPESSQKHVCWNGGAVPRPSDSARGRARDFEKSAPAVMT